MTSRHRCGIALAAVVGSPPAGAQEVLGDTRP